MKRPSNSKQWIKAMLEAGLDGNAMKILLCYMDKGAWDKGKSAFLSRRDYEAYGLSRATVTRHRGGLIESGWLVPTGAKSDYGFEYFYVELGQGASKRGRGCLNMMQGVPQNEAGGASICGTEVIEEVIEEVTDEVKDTTPALGGDASASAPASDLENKNIKEEETTGPPAPPIPLNVLNDDASPAVLNEESELRRVPQIDAPYWKRKNLRFDQYGNVVEG